MKRTDVVNELASIEEAVTQLRQAAAAKKCWACGCLHHAIESIDQESPAARRPSELASAFEAARERLVPIRYDCLGCEVCYPALAVNALARAGIGLAAASCPTETIEERAGWPPLPGNYAVLRYQAPVAICALTDDALSADLTANADPDIAIVGNLQTENLGIERLIHNVLANPNIRSLIVCGADSRQAIGHLPGQSLVALAAHGVGEDLHIVGARGKRPVLRNIVPEAVEHFRKNVEVVDLIGTARRPEILEAARACASRRPGPSEPFSPERMVPRLAGHLPERMIPDPAGYFVVYVNAPRRLLSLEHYRNDGTLDFIVEGRTPAEVYTPAIEAGLVSRLDHAAYLGRELARAEQALLTGRRYRQDGAAERAAPSPAPDRATACCSTPDSCGGHEETPKGARLDAPRRDLLA
jgi:tetrahydromethanopterin S-methyltransferase subunit A